MNEEPLFTKSEEIRILALIRAIEFHRQGYPKDQPSDDGLIESAKKFEKYILGENGKSQTSRTA